MVVKTELPATVLQKTALSGLWSLVSYAAYLLCVYALSTGLLLDLALLTATAVRIGEAMSMMAVWFRAYPG